MGLPQALEGVFLLKGIAALTFARCQGGLMLALARHDEALARFARVEGENLLLSVGCPFLHEGIAVVTS